MAELGKDIWMVIEAIEVEKLAQERCVEGQRRRRLSSEL